MDKKDKSDLMLKETLNTHNQQLESIRQYRASLLKLTSINIVLMGILLGLYGSVFQDITQIGIIFIIPFTFLLLAAVYSTIKYTSIGVTWGFFPSNEGRFRVGQIDSGEYVDSLTEDYSEAYKNNENSIKNFQNSIRNILFLMAAAFGSTMAVVVLLTFSG